MIGLEKQDWELRLICLKIAANEIIYNDGPITDIDALMRRAKDIYDSAIGDYDIFGDWMKFWKKGIEKQKVKEVIPGAAKGFKICPGCGESVPEGWKAHKFKKDKSKCGHEF